MGTGGEETDWGEERMSENTGERKEKVIFMFAGVRDLAEIHTRYKLTLLNTLTLILTVCL